jgi:RNA polymerase sigma-70 factor (ECF subfamily)
MQPEIATSAGPYTQSPVAFDVPDDEVIRHVRDGETTWFAVLMRRYNQRLFRVARAILGNDGEAEDVVQDAYVRAYTHLHQFAGRAAFATWLTRIAMHEAMARLRRRQLFVEADEDRMETLVSEAPDPEAEALASSTRTLLEAVVDALPQTYRSVFVLREVEGLSTAETAECLELSEEAVKVRLHRSRALLRKEIYARTGAATAAAFQFAGARCDRIVATVLARINELSKSPSNPIDPSL